MKIRIQRWYSALLATLIALLGFDSCDVNGSEEYGPPMEYGVPTVRYIFGGHVQTDDQKPIEGIKVKVAYRVSELWAGVDSTQTDAQGNYEMETRIMPTPDMKARLAVTFEDVDGEAHGGTFANDTVRGNDMQEKQMEQGNGHWYEGTYVYTADKTLNKKTGR